MRPADILRRLNVAYSVSEHDLGNIPRTGAAILVSNHPTHADSLILFDLLSGIRPDVRFLYGSDRPGSLSRHPGGLLVVFPAGRGNPGGGKEGKWGKSTIEFIRDSQCPVIPVCIGKSGAPGKPYGGSDGCGENFTVRIGSDLAPHRTADLGTGAYGRYLRANVEFMLPPSPRGGENAAAVPKPRGESVIEPLPRELLERETNSLPAECLLFEQSGYRVYYASPQQIPYMLSEIGRLREITFRGIGEGSMKKIDTDRYDSYYRQLFIWDTDAGMLVGAYRLGMGAEIMDAYGLRGFYSDSLFRMDRRMEPVMRRTIELGRSFVTAGYQRKPVSLMLLWKGILHILLRHPGYRYLVGPATISGELSGTSKMLIVKYLNRHHLDRKLARHIHPATGLDGIVAPGMDFSLVEDITRVGLIDKIVTDIEQGRFSIPVLIRKYLDLNSRVLGFNVDHDFSDCLDSLMLLDLKKVPPAVIGMLSKEMSGIDVASRFENI